MRASGFRESRNAIAQAASGSRAITATAATTQQGGGNLAPQEAINGITE
jgi:hypothetical protein